jgi:hypothetical protein
MGQSVNNALYIASGHTETMKIIASFSRDNSLHAVVSWGFPVGTKSKPGGGFLSEVTWMHDESGTLPSGQECTLNSSFFFLSLFSIISK